MKSSNNDPANDARQKAIWCLPFLGNLLYVACLELPKLFPAMLGWVGEWSSGAEHNLSS